MQEQALLKKKSSQGNYRLWHRNIFSWNKRTEKHKKYGNYCTIHFAIVRQYELRKRKENYCLIKKHNTLLWSNNENRPKRTRSILGFMLLSILSPSLIWRNLASVELCLAGIQNNDKSIGDECVHRSGPLFN